MSIFNETHFQAIVKVCSDAIIVVDRNKIVQFVNPAAETLFARTEKELLNSPFDYPLELGESRELSIPRKNQAPYIGEMHIVEMDMDGDVFYLATLRNITERKQRERELLFHASVQESMHDAVVATNMEQEIQSWNPAAEIIYGWQADEVIGKNGAEVLQTRFESGQDREHITHVTHKVSKNDVNCRHER
jgi:PAS domain-containing protein